MPRVFFIALLIFVFFRQSYCQISFPTNGPNDPRDNYYALINANIIKKAGDTITQGMLVIKNGLIENVGREIKPPQEATVIDVAGYWIYPSFIELHSNYGLEHVDLGYEKKPDQKQQIFLSTKKGAFGWNQAIHSEVRAKNYFHGDEKRANSYRQQGFGAIVAHVQDGIARGSGLLVALSHQPDQLTILRDEVSRHFSFDKGTSNQSYPRSLMGSIALLRQSYWDAQWYKQEPKEENLSLKAWNDQQSLPVIFDAGNGLNVTRANKLSEELFSKVAIVGDGTEYQHIEVLKNSSNPIIIPLNYPKPYEINSSFEADNLSYSQLKHWQLAPFNLAYLEQAKIPIMITSQSDDVAQFLSHLRTAIKHGLSPELALSALTLRPAQFLNVEDVLGSIEASKKANFIITSGDLFRNEQAKIIENWTLGQRHIFENKQRIEPKSYQLQSHAIHGLLKITSPLPQKFSFETSDSLTWHATGLLENGLLHLNIKSDTLTVQLTGWQNGAILEGFGRSSQGIDSFKWKAVPSEDLSKEGNETHIEVKTLPDINEIRHPFVGYGWKQKPQQQRLLFKNATVWTSEDEGILEQTDVLIDGGKIEKIGQNLQDAKAEIIDASTMHLTAGIIDEHSHICISGGVNEGSQDSSAEVRIGDVINAQHIGLYRVLAGGVTTSQLLHGSANPIGGQSALIKSRWGLSSEELKFEDAPAFIKFALGENVKQSNWGPEFNTRYPQTRMGVEQVYNKYFTKALEYEQEKKKSSDYRRDLELEALLEIVNKKRFITCHSYVQSEINMLMKVAEQFHFNVNTFTHILEGYKVADKMKRHGVGASTFSDWWAYKYEVIDAIPYNAAILTREGIVTAINSDDAEMARRLNQEAAKSIKFGGLSQEEAWKLITINPAKLLHIDERVGSIKVGKDADIVLWSDNPLSIYAKVMQTYVDGIKYFDSERAQKRAVTVKREKQNIINEMQQVNQKTEDTQKLSIEPTTYYHCEDIN